MDESIKVNIKHKDRLFCLVFGSEEYKENVLSLYNALNGTDYQDVNDITIYTIADVIYIKMKNDVALLIDSDSFLTLWEHQSTFNPNMPVRGLMYFGQMYSRYITERELNIYSSNLIKLPAPQYIVFYNGRRNANAVEKLHLSDAFAGSVKDGEFEWTATMYNLNAPENDKWINKCKALRDYITLVEKIRSNQDAGMPIEEAADRAVQYCIERNVLKALLLKHRAEVISMVLTEFNEKVFVNNIRAEGRAEEHKDILERMIANIMKRENIPKEEAEEKAKALIS